MGFGSRRIIIRQQFFEVGPAASTLRTLSRSIPLVPPVVNKSFTYLQEKHNQVDDWLGESIKAGTGIVIENAHAENRGGGAILDAYYERASVR